MKYNRIALIPHKCSKCKRHFWLEKYHYSSEFRGFYTLYTITCKECRESEVE